MASINWNKKEYLKEAWDVLGPALEKLLPGIEVPQPESAGNVQIIKYNGRPFTVYIRSDNDFPKGELNNVPSKEKGLALLRYRANGEVFYDHDDGKSQWLIICQSGGYFLYRTRDGEFQLCESSEAINNQRMKGKRLSTEAAAEIIAEELRIMTSAGRASTGDQKYKEDIRQLIDNGVKQIILTGAPGTGKTKTAKEIAEELGKPIPGQKENYMFVQFHPSYDYTDFVEGLRPVEVNGQVSFKRMDGIFKGFCRTVVEKGDGQGKYFFIIDEINRADLSKVFGELMYCLESDKRGEVNRMQTQYQTMTCCDKAGAPYKQDCFEDGFYIPENVVVLGTMNDIDRSVESMDYALRRRFNWVNMEVTEELLEGAFHYMFKDDLRNMAERADMARRVMAVNERISASDFGMNKDYYISQGQFANIPEDKRESRDDIMAYVWQYRVKPLLRDYLRGEDQEQVKTFVEDCQGKWFETGETVRLPADEAGQQ